MKFVDTAKIGGTRKTGDGYLVADVLTARTGIQIYSGDELERPDLIVVKVYRPESEVFHKDSLASYAHKPVTNDHPDEAVSAGNWKDHAVGSVGDEIVRDGNFVRVPLIVMDAKAIQDVEGGKRELSAGYSSEIVFGDGVTPDGDTYNAIQKNIRINHVAIVAAGRAGSKARIGDGAKSWGVSPLTADERAIPMSRIILVDGLQVDTTDAGAAAIEKLLGDKARLVADASAATATHTTAIAAKDAEIGALKVDLKKAQDAAPDAGKLDKLVADRVSLISAASAIFKDVKTEGVTDADIMKATVAHKLGDEMVKDAPAAEIAGMFKALAKDAKPVDPLATFTPRPLTIVADDGGQAKYEARVRDAWKGA